MNALAILVPVAIVALLVDFVLTLTWSTWYFTTGPALVRSTRVVAGAGAVPSPEALQRAATSFFLGRTRFRDLGAATYAFRRSLLMGSSVLNGTLEFDPTHHTVTLVGRLGPFSALFLLAWFLAAFSSGSPEFAAMGALIFTVIVLVEYLLMRHVLSTADRVWSGRDRPASLPTSSWPG